MRYRPTRTSYLTVAALLLLGVAVMAAVCFTDPFMQDLNGKERLIVRLVVFLPLPAIAAVLCFLAFRSGAYAMIEDDGIHVFSRKQGELAFAAWADARDCRAVGIYNGTAWMLVFRYDSTVCGKPLATYRGYPPPDRTAIRAYLLDKLIFRLARGKMTPEAFHKLPVLFLLNDSFQKHGAQKYFSMWRAAKTRADGEQEVQP